MSPTALRITLMGMVLAVQLATVVVVVTGMRQDTAQQFARNARTELDLMAESVTDRTQRYLEPAENAIHMAHNLIGAGMLDARDDRQLARFFQAQIQTNEAIRAMYVGSAEGRFVVVERDDEGLRTTVKPADGAATVTQRFDDSAKESSWQDPTYNLNPRARPWYRMARATANRWSGPEPIPIIRPGCRGISAARQIRLPDGNDAGVVGVDVDIRALSEFIARTPNTPSGTAVILDERHNAVAFSDLVPTDRESAGCQHAIVRRGGRWPAQCPAGTHAWTDIGGDAAARWRRGAGRSPASSIWAWCARFRCPTGGSTGC